ncbi:MAG TPA: Coq4 family protein [Caulobacteraceae bacterium]|jgi:ubiquinone biosynthesis protein COQ4|nr:Coq4 family protein [Caulobacteraceae bacterium]
MTDAAMPSAQAPQFDPSAMRLNLFAALKSLRALMRDKDDTTKVFEIMRALNGRSTEQGYRRLLNTGKGGEIAYRREELADLLDDDAAMSAMPAGSLGAAYFAWKKAEGLSAKGLAEVGRLASRLPPVEIQHPYAWFGRRIRDTHDLWHVLNGYGRDGLGEACLVAFSFAQTRGLGWGLIAAGAAVQGLLRGAPAAVWAIFEGWRRGRHAAWLPGEDYRALLAEPIGAARARLRLDPPVKYRALVDGLMARGLDADGRPLATAATAATGAAAVAA